MNIFKTSNQNKTAKEHIIRRRNLNLYKDLNNNSSHNKIACVKGSSVKSVSNHSSLINLSHGFYDYNQQGKCKDVSYTGPNNKFFSKSSFNVEEMKKIKNITEKDGSQYNYTGIKLTEEKYPNDANCITRK